MSNLGDYIWLTTLAKKVGGPVNLMLLASGTGAVAYKGAEVFFEKQNELKDSAIIREPFLIS